MSTGLVILRRMDLPPTIVWAALVDPVLVEGWLHPTERLVDAPDDGVVVHLLEEPRLLSTSSPQLGELRFVLTPTGGGSRGTSTEVELELQLSPEQEAPESRAALAALWDARFDQLHDLLHGHPVDWSRRAGESRDGARHLERISPPRSS